jgi:hypothetical protein
MQPLNMNLSGLTDEQLKAIGEIVAMGSWLEKLLDHAIWVLHGIRTRAMAHEGWIVTASLRTSSKTDMLKRLADLRMSRDRDTEGKARFPVVFSQLTEAISMRDSVAHGHFTLHADGQTLHTHKLNKSRKLVISQTSTKALIEAPSRILKAGIDLNQFVKRFA